MVKTGKQLAKTKATAIDLTERDMLVPRNLATLRKQAGVARAAKGATHAVYSHAIEPINEKIVRIATMKAVEEGKRTVKEAHILYAMEKLKLEFGHLTDKSSKPTPEESKPDNKSMLDNFFDSAADSSSDED